MVIITKTAQKEKREQKYYRGTCPACGTEFVCEEKDFIASNFDKHSPAVICCPKAKCNYLIYKASCLYITKEEYINKLSL